MTVTAPRFLLALDMDGTLLRDDKSIAEEDARAIRAAAAHGIAVTLATGRLTSGSLPTARELGLSTPLVCADGGLLVDPLTGDALERRSISAAHAQLAVDALNAHALTPFVFLADSIHCDHAGAQHRAVVEVWSRELVIHPSLAEARAWREPDCVSLTVGIGPRGAVEQASQHLRERHADVLDTVHFGMNGMTLWAVRSLPHGCDKGDMLMRLAARLDVPRERVAVVGDWFNDLGMFKAAGRSFAMAQAPELVKQSATDRLRSSSATGGGVAEAIAALAASL
jgi:Cof subfamily protein (haloacid dehalogenase superfamily)